MAEKHNPWNNAINEDVPTDEDTIRKLYDEFAAHYDETLDQWSYNAPTVAASYLSRFVSTDAVVLDAGCGTGLTGAALAHAGYTRIIGSDLSPVSLEQAKKTQHYEDLQELNLSQPLPFAAAQFGGVICVGVFSYIADVEPVVHELMRVMVPGGVLVFTQRDDLYQQRDNARLFNQLQADWQFDSLVATEPNPYLPGNPNFAEQIGVRYFVWKKNARA